MWPLAAVTMLGLAYSRLAPQAEHRGALRRARKAMMAVGLLLIASLALGYLLIPRSDPQGFVSWYGAALGSIPVLVPSLVACCLPSRPEVRESDATLSS